jgi:hypothetical protein
MKETETGKSLKDDTRKGNFEGKGLKVIQMKSNF